MIIVSYSDYNISTIDTAKLFKNRFDNPQSTFHDLFVTICPFPDDEKQIMPRVTKLESFYIASRRQIISFK